LRAKDYVLDRLGLEPLSPRSSNKRTERSTAEIEAEAKTEAERIQLSREKARYLWRKKGDPEDPEGIVRTYKGARGLDEELAPTQRYLPASEKYPEPAMLTVVAAPREEDGRLLAPESHMVMGVHITKLAADGSRKADCEPNKFLIGRRPRGEPALPLVLSAIAGSEEIGFAEGIEEAYTVRKLRGMPAWASGDADRLADLDITHIPASVTTAHLAVDRDANRKGEQACAKLAQRLTERGIMVVGHMVPRAYDDWNDMLLQAGADATAEAWEAVSEVYEARPIEEPSEEEHEEPDEEEPTEPDELSDDDLEDMESGPPRRHGSDHEDRIALAFVEKHKDELRYCQHWGTWLRWTGAYWEREERQLAFHYARLSARAGNAFANPKKTKPTPAKASTASGVEKFAQRDPAMSTANKDWDQDNFLLATPDGTVDLKTGELRKADPKDMITKCTSVGPKEMPTPNFDRFLREVTRNDEELIAYLQILIGYCLTGSVEEHILVFFYGPGGNGKGALLNLLVWLFGTYAKVAAMDVFTASKYDRHPTELAALAGARLVTAQETQEGRAWDEVRVKSTTGGDPITARFMHKDFFTFQPTFKPLIAGNNKPNIRKVDDAMRRRLVLMPFLFKPAEVDRDLPEKLKGEAPGILQWAIDGCVGWVEKGLPEPPRVVQAATAEYFAAQDHFAHWLEECCELDANSQAASADLYASWKKYATAGDVPPGNMNTFAERMQGVPGVKLVERLKGVRKRGYEGVALIRPTARDPHEPQENEHAERYRVPADMDRADDVPF
jgi:putative DNA primase/helicase